MKYLLAFIIGAGAGVVGTYLYFNNKIEKIIDKKVNDEMTKFFNNQTQTLPEEEVEEVTEEEKENTQYSDKPETEEKTSIVKPEEDVHTSYRKPTKEDSEEEDEKEYITDEEMKELMAAAEERMSQNPQRIDEEELGSIPVYDDVEYICHPKGDIVADAIDKPLEEQDLLDILFKPIDWRKELKDKEKIFIRVPSEVTDYTIWNSDLSSGG